MTPTERRRAADLDDGEVDDGPPEERIVEKAARERFGLRTWERPALYREAAEAATDTDFSFWAVLMLSGAIATLGLALDQTAVVIGAMLVAPLLGPLLGLGLALAVGDGRLAAQTLATVAVGAAGVVAVAAALTFLLPFQTVTAEISARARPTLLDLAIAVASGLAGAIVTLSREKRLSASIPGVAIAVALIPPLGVAGFGLAAGPRWDLVQGSLLLFGANLAGIVLSAMGAFMAVGMHRPNVVRAAIEWHSEERAMGLSAVVGRARAFRRLGVLKSPWTRAALVLGFVVAVAIPLTGTLREIVRETRVQRAVDDAVAGLVGEAEAFVLSRRVRLGAEGSSARVRVGTSAWIDDDARLRAEAAASAQAGERVELTVEQVPISADDPRRAVDDDPAPPSFSDALGTLRRRIDDALADLDLPAGVRAAGAEIVVSAARSPRVVVAYAASERLPPEAEGLIARQAARAVGLDPATARAVAVVLAPQPLPADSAARRLALDRAAALARRFDALRLDVTLDSAAVPAVRARIGTDRVRVTPGPERTTFSLPDA